MRPHTTHARDSAVRRLSLATRWTIAGSVALTGALSEVAAQAFPGKTLKASGSHSAGAARAKAIHHTSSSSPSSSLAAPSQAPQATTERQTTPEAHSETTPEQQAAPAPEAHVEAAPERHEAAPEAHVEAAPEAHAEAHSEPAPEVHAEPTREASPPARAAPETPVVSGGS
jgi:hypothetical protein